MILVYCLNETERLRYVLDELLVHRLGLSYKCTSNLSYFEKSGSHRINYGQTMIEGCLNLPSLNLLFEEGIQPFVPDVFEDSVWHKVFFNSEMKQPAVLLQPILSLPFDLFSAVFYLLSRFEEYDASAKHDQHGRYLASNSLAYRGGFLEFPLVDHWVKVFRAHLLKCFPDLQLKPASHQQLNTIDIDFAYKFRGLSLKAKLRKSVGALLKRQLKTLENTWVQPQSDPYDTYRWLLDQAKRNNTPTTFFFLLSDEGGFDKNINPSSKEMKELAVWLNQEAVCGIHPSYQSGMNSRKLDAEFAQFEALFGVRPKTARYHFLKLRLPFFYRQLINRGITKDYTLAYAECVGFRASTSIAFHFYDLLDEKRTDLFVQPACAMDVTLKDGMNLDPKAAIDKIAQLRQNVSAVDGTFVSIWHNSSFDPMEGWAGWNKVYQSLFDPN